MKRNNIILLVSIIIFFTASISISIWLVSKKKKRDRQLDNRRRVELYYSKISGKVRNKFWKKKYPGVGLVLWVDSIIYSQNLVIHPHYSSEVETLIYENINIGDSIFKRKYHDTLFIYKKNEVQLIDMKNGKVVKVSRLED